MDLYVFFAFVRWGWACSCPRRNYSTSGLDSTSLAQALKDQSPKLVGFATLEKPAEVMLTLFA